MAELVVAGGTTIAAQKVLEAIFGDQAVRSLAEHARADLLQRTHQFLEEEAERYYGAIEAAGIDPDVAERLRDAAEKVESARDEHH